MDVIVLKPYEQILEKKTLGKTHEPIQSDSVRDVIGKYDVSTAPGQNIDEVIFDKEVQAEARGELLEETSKLTEGA